MSTTAKPEMDEHTKKILAVRALMKERDEARVSGDFGKSDTFRDKLKNEFEVIIFDQNGGPSGWKFKDGSSKKLPPGIVEAELPGAVKRKRDDTVPSSTKNAKSKRDGEQAKAKVKAAKPVKPSADGNRNSSLVQSILGAGSTSAVKDIQGVKIEDMKIGSGHTAKRGNRIKVHYIGKLTNGKTFDAATNRPFPFRLGAGEVIRGWEIGCEGMKVGGKRKLTIPPEKAYGRSGAPPTIPGNATLVFEVTLLEVN